MEGLVVDSEFWNGKSVLVTGHTGFKGSWLSAWLQSLGAGVVGYSLPPPTDPSLFEAAQVADGMTSIVGDVRDFDHLSHVIAKHRPAVIIHMAAQSLVRQSYEDPIETYSTNVMGTVNLFEAVRRSDGVRVVVNVTSDKCYDNREWMWGYRENDPMGGRDPYSSSKGCAEIITAAYRSSFFDHAGICVASARGGNVIGGGDWSKDRLIPDIVLTISVGDAVQIRSPDAVRPWQHVLDPLSGYLMLAEKLWTSGKEFCGGWNFGPDNDDAKSVSWVADKITSLWSENATWTTDASPRPHEAKLLTLDCTKSKSLLGWTPKLKIADAIGWTLDWYKAFDRGQDDLRELTRAQIVRYERLT